MGREAVSLARTTSRAAETIGREVSGLPRRVKDRLSSFSICSSSKRLRQREGARHDVLSNTPTALSVTSQILRRHSQRQPAAIIEPLLVPRGSRSIASAPESASQCGQDLSVTSPGCRPRRGRDLAGTLRRYARQDTPVRMVAPLLNCVVEYRDSPWLVGRVVIPVDNLATYPF